MDDQETPRHDRRRAATAWLCCCCSKPGVSLEPDSQTVRITAGIIAIIAMLLSGIGFSALQRDTVNPYEHLFATGSSSKQQVTPSAWGPAFAPAPGPLLQSVTQVSGGSVSIESANEGVPEAAPVGQQPVSAPGASVSAPGSGSSREATLESGLSQSHGSPNSAPYAAAAAGGNSTEGVSASIESASPEYDTSAPPPVGSQAELAPPAASNSSQGVAEGPGDTSGSMLIPPSPGSNSYSPSATLQTSHLLSPTSPATYAAANSTSTAGALSPGANSSSSVATALSPGATNSNTAVAAAPLSLPLAAQNGTALNGNSSSPAGPAGNSSTEATTPSLASPVNANTTSSSSSTLLAPFVNSAVNSSVGTNTPSTALTTAGNGTTGVNSPALIEGQAVENNTAAAAMPLTQASSGANSTATATPTPVPSDTGTSPSPASRSVTASPESRSGLHVPSPPPPSLLNGNVSSGSAVAAVAAAGALLAADNSSSPSHVSADSPLIQGQSGSSANSTDGALLGTNSTVVMSPDMAGSAVVINNLTGSSGGVAGSSGNLTGSSGSLAGSSGNLTSSSGGFADSSGNITGSSGSLTGSSSNLNSSGNLTNSGTGLTNSSGFTSSDSSTAGQTLGSTIAGGATVGGAGYGAGGGMGGSAHGPAATPSMATSQLEPGGLAAIESFLGPLDAALATLGVPVEALNAALENNLGPAEAALAAAGNLIGPVDAALAAIKTELGPSGAALASSPAGQRLENLVAQAAGIAGLAGVTGIRGSSSGGDSSLTGNGNGNHSPSSGSSLSGGGTTGSNYGTTGTSGGLSSTGDHGQGLAHSPAMAPGAVFRESTESVAGIGPAALGAELGVSGGAQAPLASGASATGMAFQAGAPAAQPPSQELHVQQPSSENTMPDQATAPSPIALPRGSQASGQDSGQTALSPAAAALGTSANAEAQASAVGRAASPAAGPVATLSGQSIRFGGSLAANGVASIESASGENTPADDAAAGLYGPALAPSAMAPNAALAPNSRSSIGVLSAANGSNVSASIEGVAAGGSGSTSSSSAPASAPTAALDPKPSFAATDLAGTSDQLSRKWWLWVLVGLATAATWLCCCCCMAAVALLHRRSKRRIMAEPQDVVEAAGVAVALSTAELATTATAVAAAPLLDQPVKGDLSEGPLLGSGPNLPDAIVMANATQADMVSVPPAEQHITALPGNSINAVFLDRSSDSHTSVAAADITDGMAQETVLVTSKASTVTTAARAESVTTVAQAWTVEAAAVAEQSEGAEGTSSASTAASVAVTSVAAAEVETGSMVTAASTVAVADSSVAAVTADTGRGVTATAAVASTSFAAAAVHESHSVGGESVVTEAQADASVLQEAYVSTQTDKSAVSLHASTCSVDTVAVKSLVARMQHMHASRHQRVSLESEVESSLIVSHSATEQLKAHQLASSHTSDVLSDDDDSDSTRSSDTALHRQSSSEATGESSLVKSGSGVALLPSVQKRVTKLEQMHAAMRNNS